MPTDYEAQRDLQPELEGTERLLWAGRPRQGLILRRGDLFMIPFSLLWCGFAVYWELAAAGSGAPAFFLAFGAFFVLIGLYFVFGRFWFDAVSRRRILYGVTDERVIIRSGVFRRELKSLMLRSLSDVSLTEYGGSRGTIRFGPSSGRDTLSLGGSWPGVPAPGPQFEEIDDARQVFGLLRDAQKEA